MDVKEARSFLREHHRGILSTVRTDGRPQMSPVSVVLDWDDYRRAMQDEGRVLVRIDIERAGPDRHA